MNLDELLQPKPGEMRVQPVCETMFTDFGYDLQAIPGANGAASGYKLVFVDKAGHLYSFVLDPLGLALFRRKLNGLQQTDDERG